MEELDLIQIEEALEPSFSGMQGMLNEVYIKDAIPLLIAEVKRLRQDRAEVRRDALLEACKAICDSCYAMAKNTHVTLEYNGVYQRFEHTYRYKIGTFEEFSGHEDCKATPIRKLLTADQGQSQGKE